MSASYAEMVERIRSKQYLVIRRKSANTCQMSKGSTKWFENVETAQIIRVRDGVKMTRRDLHLNSMTLAIPEGPSGKWHEAWTRPMRN